MKAAQKASIATPSIRQKASAGPNGMALNAGVKMSSGLSRNDVSVPTSSSKPAQFQALTYPQGTESERYLPPEAWHVVQQKQARAGLNFPSPIQTKADNNSNNCACHICQGGGRHVSQPLLSPANVSTNGPAPIQRMATPNGDPNAGITAVLTAIENAAAAPAHQTVNQADDVLGGPPPNQLPNPGAQETFGLANYNDGIFALGSQAFATAAGATRLGNRAPREHSEISFISNRGVPNSVWTTQDCCLFCFGYLDTQGIPHLPLRAQPFPQAWTHPTQGWQIVRRNPYGNTQYWQISEPNGATANYILAPQPEPRKNNKRKKIEKDRDDQPKKNVNNKKLVGAPPPEKKVRVSS